MTFSRPRWPSITNGFEVARLVALVRAGKIEGKCFQSLENYYIELHQDIPERFTAGYEIT